MFLRFILHDVSFMHSFLHNVVHILIICFTIYRDGKTMFISGYNIEGRIDELRRVFSSYDKAAKIIRKAQIMYLLHLIKKKQSIRL